MLSDPGRMSRPFPEPGGGLLIGIGMADDALIDWANALSTCQLIEVFYDRA